MSVEAVSFINLVRFYADELWRVHETRSVAHLTACCRLSLRRHGVLTVSRKYIAKGWMLTPRALNVLKDGTAYCGPINYRWCSA